MKKSERIALQVYAEAADFFGPLEPPYGYKILYGPPHHKAPILFIGYNPGGDAPEAHERDRWPSVCEYATANYKFACAIRRLFDRQFLKQCVALNGIFVRTPGSDTYKKEFRVERRRSIEKFCMERVNRLVDAIDPQKIVIIGFNTLWLFGGGNPRLRNDNRDLLREGLVAGRPAIATIHLTGARPPLSMEDFDIIGRGLS